jgi:hypothetical protein
MRRILIVALLAVALFAGTFTASRPLMASPSSRGPDRSADIGSVPARLPRLPFGEHKMAVVQPHSTRVMDDQKGHPRSSPSRQLLQLGRLAPRGSRRNLSLGSVVPCAHWPDAAARYTLLHREAILAPPERQQIYEWSKFERKRLCAQTIFKRVIEL